MVTRLSVQPSPQPPPSEGGSRPRVFNRNPGQTSAPDPLDLIEQLPDPRDIVDLIPGLIEDLPEVILDNLPLPDPTDFL